MKIWDVGTRSCLVTLGGHVHRVCWSSLRRDLDLDRGKMATASLDGSLKIWDLAACLTGGVPTVGGLHYVVLRASDDRRYVAHNQGWGLSCQLTDVTSRKVRASERRPQVRGSQPGLGTVLSADRRDVTQGARRLDAGTPRIRRQRRFHERLDSTCHPGHRTSRTVHGV